MGLKRYVVTGVAAGFAAALVALPLAWVAPLFVPETAPALTYSGTVWQGNVTDIPVFETGTFKLHPRALSATLKAGNGQSYLAAKLSRETAHDLRLFVELSQLPITDGRLQGLRGVVAANITEITYNLDGCTEASGTLRTDVLQRNGGLTNWTGPELSGPVICEDGALTAILTGEDAEQSVEARLRFSPDGTYRAEITTRTVRQEAGAILPLFGFSRDGQDFKLTEQGNWR